MLDPAYTREFKKDYKRVTRRGLPEKEIQAVMQLIMEEKALPTKFKDHVLKGEYKGFGECHIRPDWLLIYLKKPQEGTVIFVRTGTHSDLFD